jgi:hypothetical protein
VKAQEGKVDLQTLIGEEMRTDFHEDEGPEDE